MRPLLWTLVHGAAEWSTLSVRPCSASRAVVTLSDADGLPMKILVTAILSVVLHVSLGWEATVVAGAVGGIWAPRHGWFVGALGTALAWAGLVVYSSAVATPAVRVLLDTMGTLAGNIPGKALVGLTVFLGAVLGALGGAVGTVLRPLLFAEAASGDVDAPLE